MKSFNPANRPALLALTGAMILGLTTLSAEAAQPVGSFANPAQLSTITVTASAEEISAAYAEVNVPTLATVSVRPSDEEIVAAFTTESRPLPTLPVVHVTATEEELIAAAIDPTDRITVMSTIRVLPSAEDLAAANAISVAEANDDSGSIFNSVFEATHATHRLHLDMPYYSFGRVLTRAPKN